MILENKLSDVTTAHIFAASPPVRNYLINYLRSHRIKVNNLMDCNVKRNGSNLMVAEDSLRLREIEVVLNHKMPIKATIDGGSQIITLREDVWHDLQTPILPMENMTMESADENISYTKGKV